MKRRRDGVVVPDADFRSYYGRPVLKAPVWEPTEIAGYFFLGGLAGASSAAAAAAERVSAPATARRLRVTALGAIALAAVALVKDLGRPARALNMLRVVKPTSPMNMGSWLLALYGPAAGVAVLADVTGTLPRAGRAGATAAAVLGPAVASYTAVLAADTAIPAWHDARRELPFVFVSSAAAAGAGAGLVCAPTGEGAGPLRLAVAATAAEFAATRAMDRQLGDIGSVYEQSPARELRRAGSALAVTGCAIAAVARDNRLGRALGGVALLAASACTRFSVFHAGVASALDPASTIVAQRERTHRAS